MVPYFLRQPVQDNQAKIYAKNGCRDGHKYSEWDKFYSGCSGVTDV